MQSDLHRGSSSLHAHWSTKLSDPANCKCFSWVTCRTPSYRLRANFAYRLHPQIQRSVANSFSLFISQISTGFLCGLFFQCEILFLCRSLTIFAQIKKWNYSRRDLCSEYSLYDVVFKFFFFFLKNYHPLKNKSSSLFWGHKIIRASSNFLIFKFFLRSRSEHGWSPALLGMLIYYWECKKVLEGKRLEK